jgi:hypothetical protein
MDFVMEPKEYITQISRSDLQELSDLTNVRPGFLIRIDKDKGGWVIGIDENALRYAINGFFRNGGCNTTAGNSQNVPFNPPS